MILRETPYPNDLSGKGRHRAWKWVSLVLQFPDKPFWLAYSFCWGIRCFSSIVLQFTAAGSYISLNDVQTTSTEYGHDTPHLDLSDIRNRCTLITYPFAIFYSPYLKFLCPIVSFSFHQLRQFLLLEKSTSEHTNSQQASTYCPCTDTETALRQLCTILLTRLLPLSVALPHRNRVSSYPPHLPFFSAVNSLPP